MKNTHRKVAIFAYRPFQGKANTSQGQTHFLGRSGRGGTGKNHRRLCEVGRPILSENHVPPAKSIRKHNYWGVGSGLGVTHLARIGGGAKASRTFGCVRRGPPGLSPLSGQGQNNDLALSFTEIMAPPNTSLARFQVGRITQGATRGHTTVSSQETIWWCPNLNYHLEGL